MLYMVEQREPIRQELLLKTNLPPTFAEVTKTVAVRWTSLDIDFKKKYLEASEAARER